MTLFIYKMSRTWLIVSLLISFLGTPVVGKDIDGSIQLTPENINKQSRCKFDIRIRPAYEPARNLHRQMEVHIKVDSRVPELKNSDVVGEFHAGTVGHFFLKSQIKDGKAVFFLSVTPEILEQSWLVLHCRVPEDMEEFGSFKLSLRDFLTKKHALEIKKLEPSQKTEAGTKLKTELAMLDFETGETGLTRDLRFIRKTFVRAKETVQFSSPDAIAAAKNIFGRLNLEGMSKEDVIWMLGDPETICDNALPMKPGKDSDLIYRFDNPAKGFDGIIKFKNGKVSSVTFGPTY